MCVTCLLCFPTRVARVDVLFLFVCFPFLFSFSFARSLIGVIACGVVQRGWTRVGRSRQTSASIMGSLLQFLSGTPSDLVAMSVYAGQVPFVVLYVVSVFKFCVGVTVF